MGGAKRYPSIAAFGSDGFRKLLNPSYTLESIDRFVFDSGPDQRLEAFAVGDIDASAKHIFEVMDDADILKQANARFGRDLDHDIDIAPRAIVAAVDGTEKRGVGDPLRPQLRLTIPQLPYDLIALHGVMIAQRPPTLQPIGGYSPRLTPQPPSTAPPPQSPSPTADPPAGRDAALCRPRRWPGTRPLAPLRLPAAARRFPEPARPVRSGSAVPFAPARVRRPSGLR